MDMPDTPEVIIVCRPCRGNMHVHCYHADCACLSCRHTCEVCGQPCRVIRVIPGTKALAEDLRDKKACTTCYLTATALLPRGQGCEDCDGPSGYRNPRDPSGTYRCIACHEAAGTQATDTVYHL